MSIFSSKELFIYYVSFSAITGLILGSFLNCMAWRIAHHESFIKGRSHCPKCGHVLGIFDLIPIVSWILHTGKCYYCKESISIRYPLTELFMAIMSVLCLIRYDLSVEWIRNYILLCCLFTLSLIDLETFEIPDLFIVIPIISWMIFANYLNENIMTHICSALFYSGNVLIVSLIMDKLLEKESIGGGDIKLIFVMGLYLGIIGGMLGLFLSCVIGLIFGLIEKKDEDNHFPFGPAISVSLWILLMYGQPIINWYKCLLI